MSILTPKPCLIPYSCNRQKSLKDRHCYSRYSSYFSFEAPFLQLSVLLFNALVYKMLFHYRCVVLDLLAAEEVS